jgi:putative hydrolase of the HAD superfamily
LNLGLVFDLDDTLYPEFDYVRSGFTAVGAHLEQAGLTPPGEFATRAWQRFTAGQRTRVFDDLLAEFRVPDPASLTPQLVALYRDHLPTLSLFPDAARFLSALDPHTPRALITDGYATAQRNKVQALQLADHIPTCVFSDDFGRACWKPHPRPFQEVESRLGLPGQDLVYVGDNPLKDFVGARARGWRSVRIRRPNTLHFRLEAAPDHEPDLELTSFAELEGALAALRRR